MADSEWFSPRKIFDYYMPGFSDPAEAEKDLRIAVITGQVRARVQGDIIGPDMRGKIARTVYDNNPEALPPDIELSVEHAKRVYSR